MKLTLITKVLTLCISKPEKLRDLCSIHFHHVHSLLGYLVDVHHFQNHIVVYGSFLVLPLP